MALRRVQCPACEKTFEIEAGQDSARCGVCGYVLDMRGTALDPGNAGKISCTASGDTDRPIARRKLPVTKADIPMGYIYAPGTIPGNEEYVPGMIANGRICVYSASETALCPLNPSGSDKPRETGNEQSGEAVPCAC